MPGIGTYLFFVLLDRKPLLRWEEEVHFVLGRETTALTFISRLPSKL